MAELTLKDINKTLQDNNDMLENLTSDVSEIGRSLLKDQVDRHRQEQTDRRQKSADRLMYLEFLREQKDKGATPHTHSHAGGGWGEIIMILVREIKSPASFRLVSVPGWRAHFQPWPSD